MPFTSRKRFLFFPIILLSVLLLGNYTAKGLQAVVMKNIFYAPTANQTFTPYLETYWQIDPRSMLFTKENGAFLGKIKTGIIITNDTGIAKQEHYILATNPVAEGVQLYSQNIMDLRRYELKPGKYRLQITFTDELKPTSQYVYSDSFMVEEIAAPTLSDIQLIDTIIASDQQNIFLRNGHLQIPLATNFLDEHRKTLHYYAELYRPSNDSSEQFIYTAFISKKSFDPPVNRLIKKDTLPKAPVQIIEQKFSLNTLSSGNYHLNILVHNDKHQKVSSKSLFFQLLNANPQQLAEENTSGDSATGKTQVETTTYLNLNKSFLGKYTPAQLRAILKMLIPIADPNERTSINGFLKNPDDTYARYFVNNFWTRRNKTNPEAAWKEYAEKVKQVNKLFGSSLLAGYENERGAIYLKYGAPTERIVVNNENNAYPYEVWQYNTLTNASNAIFLFYRPGLVTNDYRLLHTTVNGEIRNRNWRANLYIDGGSSDASNSRAEQYIGNR
ncbi:MAG TPA: GWxTD domain-containing protein [Flavipsychrobacter sp.]|nr:GWxTD domain-containing protein [Flavipsychrobacter sp.]